MPDRTTSPTSGGDGGVPSLTKLLPWGKDPVLLRLQPKGLPVMFEDEDLEMGESSLHTDTCTILLSGVGFHLRGRRGYRAFSNLNLYYSPENPAEYASPDLMVVRPTRRLPANVSSYRIGDDGPAPVLAGEVLSFRTYQQGDLTAKPVLYASLGIPEYLLVDVTGELLPQRLLLLRRQADGTWAEEQDADGGITSRLGFRVLLEEDGQARVVDAKTGERYPRPDEAVARVRELELELARLRGKGRKRKGS
jgi:Uma2 family endonuclease